MTWFWLGSCTSPVSLFTMGIWMQEQGVHQLLFSVKLGKLALYLLSKLVLVPLAMAGIAKLMRGFENEPGRAAVLIASLPTSATSFSLGHQYMLGEAELSANVAAGTLLMLPTVLVWNVVMDSPDLFPS
jgi:predicted permease